MIHLPKIEKASEQVTNHWSWRGMFFIENFDVIKYMSHNNKETKIQFAIVVKVGCDIFSYLRFLY